MDIRRLTLLIIGLIGSAVYISLFALTYSIPNWVETFAADYIETEARKRIDTTIETLEPPKSDTALSQLANKLYEYNESKLNELRTQLKDQVHKTWAEELAKVRDLDCSCRQKWEDWFEQGLASKLLKREAIAEQLNKLVHASYMHVSTELKRDIRIFSGSNALAFLLLLVISFSKPRATAHLFVPALLLAASSIICTCFYVFEQNWFLTIIHNDHLGFAYLAWLALVFAFLLDIILNRGMVTANVIKAVMNALGSAASVGPC